MISQVSNNSVGAIAVKPSFHMIAHDRRIAGITSAGNSIGAFPGKIKERTIFIRTSFFIVLQ